MTQVVALLVLALSTVLAASPANFDTQNYVLPRDADASDTNEVILPQKRAALVLDRLLIALQKALNEEGGQRFVADRDGPRTAPLRIAAVDSNDMTGLQRRGQGTGRGRVYRCYFNAVTCF